MACLATCYSTPPIFVTRLTLYTFFSCYYIYLEFLMDSDFTKLFVQHHYSISFNGEVYLFVMVLYAQM